MRWLRLLGKIIGKIIVGLVAVLAFAFAALQTAPGQRALASLVSKLATTADGGLEIAGLHGFFPTDLTVERLAYRDRDGPWLTADNLRLRWSFASLFERRLQIEVLSADRIGVVRPPLPDKQPATEKSGEPLSLPLEIDLQALSIADLHLGAALAGIDSRWKITGNAHLPPDLVQGRLVLDGTRIDGPAGKLAANVRFDARQRSIDGEVSLSEQRGGIVAVLLERPDIEDLSMRLVARGDARTGQADLNVTAADAVRITGKLTWEPQGATTKVVARIDSAAPGLPQNPVADALRGPIRLDAQATIDDKVVVLSGFKLATTPVTVDASARYDIEGDRLDATATVDSPEPGALGPLAGGASWRGLRVQIKADLGSLATLPQGSVTLTGSAADVSLAAINPQIPALGPIRLQANLGFADGKATVQSLDVRSTPASLIGTGSYVLASKAGELKATVTLPDFAVFSTLAGQPLAGQGAWDVTATSDAKGLSVSWQGTVSDLGATGLPPQLVNARVALSGAATWQFDQSWTLKDVRVAAADNAVLSISGRGQAETADLDLSLDLPSLAWVQPDVAGRAKITAAVRQSTAGTDLRVTGEVSDLHHGPLTSRRVSLTASLSRDPAGAIQGTMTTNGDLVDQALSLEGRFRYDAGGLAVPTFQGKWASAVLDVVDLAITQTRRSGRAQLKIARLQDVAPLAGTELAGSIDLDLTAADIPADSQATTDPAAAGQVTVTLQGKGLRSGATSIASLALKGTVKDPLNAAITDATLTANGMGGVADIDRVTVTANGNRKGLVVALQAAGARTGADLRGKVEPDGNDILISLSRLDGRHSGIPVALAAPTRVRIAGQRVVLDPTNLRLGGGRLSARGTIDPTASDLQLELAALPLSLVDAVAPGTGLEGTAQAKVQVRGALTAPRIDATYGVTGLRLRRPDTALVPPLSIQGSGTMSGNQASVDARLSAGGATNLTVKGRVAIPRSAGAPSGSATVTGALDIAPFSPLLGNDLRNVTGTLRPNLTVDLSGSKISGSGTIDFANGALALPESGLRLSGGEGRLALQGDTVQIQRLNFQTGRNGTLSLAGTIRLDAQQGVMPDISVTSRNALLVNRPDLMAAVSTNLKVSGSTGTAIDISGPITIDRAEISIGGQQSASYPTLDVREVNRPGSSPPVPTAQPAARPRQPPPPTATPIRLALKIQAPRAVFVRGRGLDAEMGGELQVSGSPTAPAVAGGLTMRRGEFDLLGRRLTFSRGVVTLDNLDAIDPRLDFLASTTVQSTTVNVEIKGTARAPIISVNAGGLPPDEAMAMLLFGKPASGLSPFELAQAAQGLAELTGASPGSGVLSRLRGGLGLDRLSVGSSGSGANPQMSIEAGRYVAPGVYIGARQGASGNSSRGVVQIDVLDNVKIEGDIGADSNGRVGVKMQWDY